MGFGFGNNGLTPQQKRALAAALLSAAQEQERVETAFTNALEKIADGVAELKAIGA